MTGPSWLADVLAAVVIAVALFSAARLVASRGQRRRRGEVDADGVHVLMGVAMAGMFVPRLATFPTPVWEAVFAAGALWFGWRTAQLRRLRGPAGHSGHTGVLGLTGLPGLTGRCCRYPLPHLVDCVAMLYMLWAIPALGAAGAVSDAVAGGMSDMGGAAGGLRLPVLGLVFVVCICIYVVWLGDRIQSFSPVPLATAASEASAAGRWGAAWMPAGSLLAPRAATCCKIAMGVAMSVMLIDLL